MHVFRYEMASIPAAGRVDDMKGALMRSLLLISLLITAFATASPPATVGVQAGPPSHDPGTDGTVSVTVVNSFSPAYCTEILDLAWMPSGYLLFTSIADSKIYACDPNSGAYVDDIDAYDTNPAAWGVMYGPTGGVLTTNDYTVGNLFTWSGTTWSESPNPAGIYGRGLEYDLASGAVWEATSMSTGRYLYRFVPGGGTAFYTVSGPTSWLSGLGLFPLGSGLGIVVASYSDPHLYVYQYVGTSLSYVGYASCPASGYPDQFSLGMTYAASRGTFFWSYVDSQGYTICELDIEVDLGLEPATWGSIKTLF
jgi:hypothetical protein